MDRKELLRRGAPYALIVAAALAVTWSLFRTAGLPYNVDISGFFPLSSDAYEGRFWPLWNERGGISTLQLLPAILFELPLLVVGHLFGWGMDLNIKVRMMLGFALAGIAMYALASYHIEKRFAERLSPLTRAMLPVVPALFYMFNPWSVHRAFQWFLWLGYGFAPLVLLAFERLADEPSWRRALALAFVAAVGTTDPHNPPMFAIVVAPFLVFRFVFPITAESGAREGARSDAQNVSASSPRASRLRGERARLLRALGIAAAAYVLIGAYWILPYLNSALTNPGFGPTYVLSDDMLDVLSRHASLADVIRLTHNYNPRAPLAPAGGAALALWNVASLAVPILAAVAIVLARKREVFAYGALGVGAIVLGMGSQGLGSVYRWMLFDAPWGEGLSWLFRDPYRWGGIQALAFAALLSFALAEISSEIRPRLRPRPREDEAAAEARFPRPRPSSSLGLGLPRAAVPLAALACIALFVAPGLVGYVGAVYSPVTVPEDYSGANAYLATTPAQDGVVWMPRALGPTTWSGQRTLEYFDATSSSRSAMGPFRPHTSLYFRFLEDATKDGADVPSLLARVGAQRVAFHNDRDPVGDAGIVHALEDTGLDVAARAGDSPTRVIDASSLAPADTPATRASLNGTRALTETFVPALADPAQVTLRANAVGEAGPLEIMILDASGNATVVKRVRDTSQGADLTVSLRGAHLVPNASYAIRVRAANASAPGHWDVSYYKIDTYGNGTLSMSDDGAGGRAVEGDLAFELQSVGRGFVTILQNPQEAPRLRASSGTIASPGGLSVLRALAVMPNGSPMQDAPVVFTSANEAARESFAAQNDSSLHWVAPLAASPWEAVVPFLPKATLVAPFLSTVNADGKSGWARGTEDFTYYENGWSTSVAALGQESWDFDNDRGFAYTSSKADLTMTIPRAQNGTIVLARVFEHPEGGAIAFRAGDDATIGRLDTRAPQVGYRWREVGVLRGGETSISMRGDGAFEGVNLLAVVPPADLAAAQLASARRFATTPVTLVEQAELVPGLATRLVAYPGVGRFAQMGDVVNVPFTTPATGAHALWIRVANGSSVPDITVDGHAAADARCVDSCEVAASWWAVPLGDLASGAHALGLATPATGGHPLIDLLAVTNDPAIGRASSPDVQWQRVDATHYRVHLSADGPVELALAQPYDAGWVATDAHGARVRSVVVDGVTNGFALRVQGDETFDITYEPQTWALRGVGMSVLALAGMGAALLAMRLARIPKRPKTESLEDLS